MKVPAISKDGKPLMPTTEAKARKLVKKGKATPFFKLGIFCIRLNEEVSNITQSTVLGIDPGSKKEAYTVKSASNTYCNIQCDAIDYVKERLEERKNMRRGRRFRKTPYRKPRWANRANSKKNNRVPPSTKARADLRLGIARTLAAILPINGIVCEDVKAETKKGKKRWNSSFSPVQSGKKYFYSQLEKIAPVITKEGHQTADYRRQLSLYKTKNKMSKEFSAHCVDSWVLANSAVGGHNYPDNKKITYLSPIQYSRRQLHKQQFVKGGKRSRFGGTRSFNFKKGSIVKLTKPTETTIKSNPKHLFLVGGYDEKSNKITICSIKPLNKDGGRISRCISPKDLKFRSFNRFKISQD